MKLSALEAMINMRVDDESLAPFIKDYINDAIAEIAANFDLPTLKVLDPWELTVDSTSWYWEMPDGFQKKLFRCAYRGTDGKLREVKVFDRREDLEFKDHTEVGTTVNAVAVTLVDGTNYLLIHPLPQNPVTLYLWGYKKPTPLVRPNDVPTCVPEEFHEAVIVPPVMIKCYELLQDQVESFNPAAIQEWQKKEVAGLYGAPGQSVGLINYLLKIQGPPRRHGGRQPVGLNYFRYGR